jgi:intein/homing endonuclease
MEKLDGNITYQIEKLVEEISDEHLVGKPEILKFCLFSNIEKFVLKEVNKIEDNFKRQK